MRSPVMGKDFLTGVGYALIGGSALYFGRDYAFGTLSRMGPGFFPLVLGAILTLIGIALSLRALLRGDERIGALSLRPLVLVVGSIFLFAWLLPLLGMPLTLAVLIAVASLGSPSFRPELRFALVMAAVILACVGLFVYGLGVRMPVAGSLFGG